MLVVEKQRERERDVEIVYIQTDYWRILKYVTAHPDQMRVSVHVHEGLIMLLAHCVKK